MISTAELRPLLPQLNGTDFFVQANLDAAVARIRSFYLQHGFNRVQVTGDARELNPEEASAASNRRSRSLKAR